MRYQVYVTIGTFSDELEAALRYDEQAARLGKPVNFPEDGTNQKKASKWGSASAAALASPRSSFLQHDESLKGKRGRGKKRAAKTTSQSQNAAYPPTPFAADPAALADILSEDEVTTKKYTGVSQDKTRSPGHQWRVRIQLGGKRRIIGSYASEDEAARAYDVEAAKYGLKLNFPISDREDAANVPGLEGAGTVAPCDEQDSSVVADMNTTGAPNTNGHDSAASLPESSSVASSSTVVASSSSNNHGGIVSKSNGDDGGGQNTEEGKNDEKDADNPRRAKKRKGGSSSRFVGVSWARNRKRWKSQCMVKGVSKVLGFFKSEVVAARRYDICARGEGKPTNFLSDEEIDGDDDEDAMESYYDDFDYLHDEDEDDGVRQAGNVRVAMYKSESREPVKKKPLPSRMSISASRRAASQIRWAKEAAVKRLAEQASGDDLSSYSEGSDDEEAAALSKRRKTNKGRSFRMNTTASPRRSGRTSSSSSSFSNHYHAQDFRTKCPICLENFIETFEAAAAEVIIEYTKQMSKPKFAFHKVYSSHSLVKHNINLLRRMWRTQPQSSELGSEGNARKDLLWPRSIRSPFRRVWTALAPTGLAVYASRKRFSHVVFRRPRLLRRHRRCQLMAERRRPSRRIRLLPSPWKVMQTTANLPQQLLKVTMPILEWSIVARRLRKRRKMKRANNRAVKMVILPVAVVELRRVR